jgi:hypothetical protein
MELEIVKMKIVSKYIFIYFFIRFSHESLRSNELEKFFRYNENFLKKYKSRKKNLKYDTQFNDYLMKKYSNFINSIVNSCCCYQTLLNNNNLLGYNYYMINPNQMMILNQNLMNNY